jgi:hypothetical protein
MLEESLCGEVTFELKAKRLEDVEQGRNGREWPVSRWTIGKSLAHSRSSEQTCVSEPSGQGQGWSREPWNTLSRVSR